MIADRLDAVLKLAKNQAEFAEKIGAHPNMITKWKKGITSPSAQYLVAICEQYKINAQWLLMGVEPMIVEDEVFSYDQILVGERHTPYGAHSDYAKIRQVDGMDPDGPQHTSKPFSVSWLEWRLNGRKDFSNLVLIKSTHAVRDPFILWNDLFLIDLEQTRFVSSAYMLFKFDDGLHCVIKAFKEETYFVLSPNDLITMAPILVDIEGRTYCTKDAEILGRAIWLGRDL